MRRKLVVGNWKMFGLRADLPQVEAIAAAAAANPLVDVALCLPFTLIERAVAVAGAMPVGAQDVHEWEEGPHTGCVSAPMLVETGATVAIVGHSERRKDQHETSHDAWAKAAAAHRNGLKVILCCGENEAERKAGRAKQIVRSQIEKSLPRAASGDWLTIAYEPRWAIGTGRTPTLDEIAEIHAMAREKLREMAGEAAEGIRILYGGSVTAKNAAAILRTGNVDGALVGGASLTAEKFVPIIEAATAISS